MVQTTTPTLHHLSSSGAHRCLWALEELADAHDIKYHLVTYTRSNPPPAALKSFYPLGKSPVVVISDGIPPNAESAQPNSTIYQTHPGILTEGRLILQFFSDQYGQGMWDPETPEDKARDVFFSEFGLMTIALKTYFAMLFEMIPMFLPWGLRHIVALLVSPIINHFCRDLVEAWKIMEDALTDEKPWFSGKKIGLADFNMSFPMDICVQRKFFLPDKYPKLKEWHDRITSRDAYKRALEMGSAPYDLVRFNAL